MSHRAKRLRRSGMKKSSNGEKDAKIVCFFFRLSLFRFFHFYFLNENCGVTIIFPSDWRAFPSKAMRKLCRFHLQNWVNVRRRSSSALKWKRMDVSRAAGQANKISLNGSCKKAWNGQELPTSHDCADAMGIVMGPINKRIKAKQTKTIRIN